MRAVIDPSDSLRPRSRSAATGMSAISRAIAVLSFITMANFVENRAQISLMSLENLGGFVDGQPETQKDRTFHVASGVFQIARGLVVRTPDDLGDNRFAAVLELCVASAQMHHQAAVHSAHPGHEGSRQKIEHHLLSGSGLHTSRAGNDLRASFHENG